MITSKRERLRAQRHLCPATSQRNPFKPQDIRSTIYCSADEILRILAAVLVSCFVAKPCRNQNYAYVLRLASRQTISPIQRNVSSAEQ
jgi:hypothetical protein